jgi:phytoene synthase
MPLSYCGNLVRQQDPDRFLISLFAPAPVREALWALYAFNYEIARTREVVSETTMGLIRLQWWRDSIEELYKNETPRRHEVLMPLADAVKKYNLPKDLFLNLIYAREFDLENVAPTSMQGLLNYADFTTTPLTMLAQRITGDSDTDDVVKAVSVNYALVGLVRSVPHYVSSHRCMLPEDILGESGIAVQKLYDFNQKENLPEVIDKVISRVTEIRNVRSRVLRAYNALTQLYANQIRALDCNVYDPRMALPPKFKEARL